MKQDQEGSDPAGEGLVDLYHNDAIISVDALADLADQGSEGAMEALKHVTEVAVESAVKWTLGRG